LDFRRFEGVERIAESTMATVFRARDRVSGQEVALKEARLGFERRLEMEAVMLEELQHHRILRHVAHGKLWDGRSLLVTEWLRGSTLHAAMREGVSLRQTLELGYHLCEALAFAHERHVVHRDIKPTNIFLRDGSTSDLVLLDFGAARDTSLDDRLTLDGVLIGSYPYMAPEQALGELSVGPAADVFAAGLVLYECLAGHRAFEGTGYGVLAKIVLADPAPLGSLNPMVPEAVSRVVMAMLSKDPSLRPSAQSLVSLLAELRAEMVECSEVPLVPRRRTASVAESTTVTKRPPVVERQLD